MQSDEEVGKVAAPVPVIISRYPYTPASSPIIILDDWLIDCFLTHKHQLLQAIADAKPSTSTLPTFGSSHGESLVKVLDAIRIFYLL